MFGIRGWGAYGERFSHDAPSTLAWRRHVGDSPSLFDQKDNFEQERFDQNGSRTWESVPATSAPFWRRSSMQETPPARTAFESGETSAESDDDPHLPNSPGERGVRTGPPRVRQPEASPSSPTSHGVCHLPPHHARHRARHRPHTTCNGHVYFTTGFMMLKSIACVFIYPGLV